MNRPARPAAVTLAVLLLVSGVQLTAGPAATADETPGAPAAPGAAEPPKVDPDDPGLKMRDGATLAAPRVLDIVSIVETEGGEERREETTTSLTLALQAEVLFGKDSAVLTAQSAGRMAAIVNEIRRNRPGKIRVFGFTDDLGTYEHGLKLSKERAEAVHGVLSRQLNNPNIVYEVRGYSEDFPIADNATEEGRRKNRRVEITFPTGSRTTTGTDSTGTGSGDSGGSAGSVGSGDGTA
ncbi:OmpA family protein [Streptomyces sp. NPDC094448]|uniref:OmpA family protein n=1 Tax=Streptomyces sp. NPDC094448 TaxID=3366063 RepID=UPI00382985F3